MPRSKNNNDVPTRGIPNNPEAEAGVLGCILIDNEAADLLIPKLKEDDFFVERHRKIFKAMVTLHNADKPIDAVTVADELEVEKELESVGSVPYLSELAESVISAVNGEYYVSLIKRDSMLRKVIHAGNDMANYAYDCQEGNDALEQAERLVYELSEQNTEKALVKADDALAKVMASIQDAQVGKQVDGAVRTFFPQFDRVTKGLKPGELILLAARPSVGKTAFALNIAANVALSGKKVAIFSLEMAAELLVKRMLAYVSGVSFNDMDRRGGLSGELSERLMKAYRRLLAADLYIDDYSINTPADVLSKCRRLKREKGLDLIVVDYLQLMQGKSTSSRGFESRQVEVSDMTRKMKIYSKELNCPILLLSQMSRTIEERQTEPMLSDLRESGAIEQDADIVAFLHRPASFNKALPENEIKLLIKKNRNGALASIDMDFSGETTAFKEVDGEREEGVSSGPKPKTESYQDADAIVAKREEPSKAQGEKRKGEETSKEEQPEPAEDSRSDVGNVRFLPEETDESEAELERKLDEDEREDEGLKPVEELLEGLIEVDDKDVFDASKISNSAPPTDDDVPFDPDDAPFDPEDGNMAY